MKKRFGLAMLMLSLAVAGSAESASAADATEVTLGYSHVVGPVANMSTVIVGDNAVADATLGGGGTIILTGKSLGATNLIILDASGGQLLSSPITVVPLDRRPTTSVRVVNGVSAGRNYLCGRGTGCSASAGSAQSPDAPAAAPQVTDETTTEPAEAPEGADTAAREQVSLNP